MQAKAPRRATSADSGPQLDRMLPLSEPVLQILISLAGDNLHGYGIIRDIEERTSGALVMSTSTLYGALQRMMRDDLIERSEQRPAPELDDERRHYYRITDFGRSVAQAEADRIEHLAQMLRNRRFQPRGS